MLDKFWASSGPRSWSHISLKYPVGLTKDVTQKIFILEYLFPGPAQLQYSSPTVLVIFQTKACETSSVQWKYKPEGKMSSESFNQQHCCLPNHAVSYSITMWVWREGSGCIFLCYIPITAFVLSSLGLDAGSQSGRKCVWCGATCDIPQKRHVLNVKHGLCWSSLGSFQGHHGHSVPGPDPALTDVNLPDLQCWCLHFM